MRDPYASLLLHGVKTVETRTRPLLQGTEGLCLLHIGHKLMDEEEASLYLWKTGLVPEAQIERVTRPPPGFARGQVLGLVELGPTHIYTEAETKKDSVQRQVTAEAVGKFATPVKRAWWLQRPLPEKGQPGVWPVRIPLDLLPPDLEVPAAVAATVQVVGTKSIEEAGPLPTLTVFDLDGICWTPEMYQISGGAPFRLTEGGNVALSSNGEPVTLFSGVKKVWSMLHRRKQQGERVAVAVASSSRRNKALPLLSTFEVEPGVTMADVVGEDNIEMFYVPKVGKRPHLENLLKKTGVKPLEVVFVDDKRENCQSVEPPRRPLRARQQSSESWPCISGRGSRSRLGT